MKRFHPSYAMWWGAWALMGIVVLLFRNHLPGGGLLWSRIHVVWLLSLEAVALQRKDKGLADALSPIMQALARRASNEAAVWQGFRALVAGIAALISLECGYVVSVLWGWWPVGSIVAGTLFLWLLFHWVYPEKYDRRGDDG